MTKKVGGGNFREAAVAEGRLASVLLVIGLSGAIGLTLPACLPNAADAAAPQLRFRALSFPDRGLDELGCLSPLQKAQIVRRATVKLCTNSANIGWCKRPRRLRALKQFSDRLITTESYNPWDSILSRRGIQWVCADLFIGFGTWLVFDISELRAQSRHSPTRVVPIERGCSLFQPLSGEREGWATQWLSREALMMM